MVCSLFWLHANPVTVELLYIKRKLKIEFNKKIIIIIEFCTTVSSDLFYLLGMVLGENEKGVSDD